MFWWLCLLNIILAITEVGVAGSISLAGVAMSSPETLLDQPLLTELKTVLPLSGSTPQVLRLLSLILSGVLVLTITKSCLLAYITWLQNNFSQRVAWDTGSELFRRYLNAPYLWHTSKNSSDLLMILNWKGSVANFFVCMLTLFTQIVIVVFLISSAIIVDPLMACFLFCSISIFALVVQKKSRKKLYSLSSSLCHYSAHNFLASMQGLHGIREVIIYDQRKVFHDMYKKYIHQTIIATCKQALYPSIPQWGLESAGMGLLLIVLIYMMIQEYSVAKVSGVLTLLAAISWRLIPAANKIMGAALRMRNEQAEAENVLSTLVEMENVTSLLPRKERTFKQNITLHDISFSYPQASSLALDNVSLVIPKGKMIGFVGLSGSGKSTLSGIIIGLLNKSKGSFSVDETPYDPATERLNIGYVPQHLYLLDASLAENVAFSSWGQTIDEARVLECCRMAAIDFLDDLPDGIDTVLGERGVRLSGGQIQRIGIARALYCNPEILVFDEATSALDGAAENEIQATINSLRNSATLLLIAHRLSTISACDIIYWVDRGRIKKWGKPHEVLPYYQARLQKKSDELE